jgi:hypothetical protein
MLSSSKRPVDFLSPGVGSPRDPIVGSCLKNKTKKKQTKKNNPQTLNQKETCIIRITVILKNTDLFEKLNYIIKSVNVHV